MDTVEVRIPAPTWSLDLPYPEELLRQAVNKGFGRARQDVKDGLITTNKEFVRRANLYVRECKDQTAAQCGVCGGSVRLSLLYSSGVWNELTLAVGPCCLKKGTEYLRAFWENHYGVSGSQLEEL